MEIENKINLNNVNELKLTEQAEIDINDEEATKMKKKIIKLSLAGIAGLTGIKYAENAGLEHSVKLFIKFLERTDINPLGILPIPNYLAGLFVVYPVLELVLAVMDLPIIKNNKKGGR